jgi:hypothetical protein
MTPPSPKASFTPFGRWHTGRNPRDRGSPLLSRVTRSNIDCLPITHVVLPTGAGADSLAQTAPVFAPSLRGTMAA